MRTRWQIPMAFGVVTALASGFVSKVWLPAKAPAIQPLAITILGASNTANGHAVCFGITNMSSRPHHIYFPPIHSRGRGTSSSGMQKSILNPGEGLVEVAYSGRDYNVWQFSLQSIAPYSKTEQWRLRLAHRISVPMLTRMLEPEISKPVVSKGPLMIRNNTLSIPDDL